MRRAALIVVAVALLAGCASGPRMYSFKSSDVRGATKTLNRLGAEAKPHVEEICTPTPQGPGRVVCVALRKLYKGALGLADGIDEAMNKSDAENTQAVDLGKVLEVGFRVLDLVTEEEAATLVAGWRTE